MFVALLTGLPAGQADEHGVYPEGALHRAVADRLAGYAEILKALSAPKENEAAASQMQTG